VTSHETPLITGDFYNENKLSFLKCIADRGSTDREIIISLDKKVINSYQSKSSFDSVNLLLSCGTLIQTNGIQREDSGCFI
jgi:hypothetical protein